MFFANERHLSQDLITKLKSEAYIIIMEKDYQSSYIECADECRNTGNSKEGIAKMYDLLYRLQQADRTKDQDLILVNVYTFLGYHQSAYDLAKLCMELADRKNIAKLYTLESKAKSHQNNFIIKDLRKLKQRNTPIALQPADFVVSAIDENLICIKKDIVIFNKIVKAEKVKVFIYAICKPEDYIDRINDYLFWMADCQKELILFYNQEFAGGMPQKADTDWYDTLEVFGLKIIIGDNGRLYAEVASGDEYMPDHILDVEMQEREILAIQYDG